MPSHLNTAGLSVKLATMWLVFAIAIVSSFPTLKKPAASPLSFQISETKVLPENQTSVIDAIKNMLSDPTIPTIVEPEGNAIKPASTDSGNTHDVNNRIVRRKFPDLPKDGRGAPIDMDNYITLINATPYRWRKGYSHSYQVFHWDDWPEYIEPGESFRYLSSLHGPHSGDSAGEVAYHLEGTKKPMSFMVERRKGKNHDTWIRFLEDLETKGNGKLSEHNLGHQGVYGSANFIIAGTEGGFYSTEPPTAWMQSLLPEIGKQSLREIVMPRSHHAGLWKANHLFSHGKQGNTAAQSRDLKFQLTQGGSRVLDIRPNFHKGKIWEGHGTFFMNQWCGTLGATLDDMIDTINEFQKKNPGELIIWDVHPKDAWWVEDTHGIPHWKHHGMREEDREFLYKTFKKLENRLRVPENEDITEWPLERFIGGKTSGVLIRVGESWAEEDIFPGGKEGFISPRNFPYSHHWSDTSDNGEMFNDQLEYLAKARPRRDSMVYHADWILTQQDTAVLGYEASIPELNLKAWTGLYKEFWDRVDENTYPNWIAMDGIQSTELSALVVAINYCLVAKRCGELGGKVKKTK
ncbi:Fc.00g098410.m01.CDS01 [Cosmosporella sp. VM-42]